MHVELVNTGSICLHLFLSMLPKQVYRPYHNCRPNNIIVVLYENRNRLLETENRTKSNGSWKIETDPAL